MTKKQKLKKQITNLEKANRMLSQGITEMKQSEITDAIERFVQFLDDKRCSVERTDDMSTGCSLMSQARITTTIKIRR